MIDRRYMSSKFIYLFVLTCAASSCAHKQQVAFVQKPNIIFLFTDDQTLDAIHALGNKEIHTPNLDRLARMGASFTNASNMGAWSGAVCVASRTMINSGRSLWAAQNISNAWIKGDSVQSSWPKLMHQAGYTTYMTGKWHVDLKPATVFDVVKDVKPGMAPDNWNHEKMRALFANEVRYGKLKAADIMPSGYKRPMDENDRNWLPYDTAQGGYWSGGRHWNEVLKDDAISFIKTASLKNEPFFMYIASNAPHDPRQAPKKYQDMYPLDKISLPKNWLPEYPYKDDIDNGPALRDEALAPFPRTEYATKKHIQEYYASVSYLDEKIGEILDAIQASGKAANTHIFFTSDHGLAIGRHGLLGKQSLFEHSVKPPLIIAGPGIPANSIVTTPVYLQDVMASTLELAGAPKPSYVFFHSLLALAKGETTQGNYDAIFGSYLDVERSIKKDNLKLILYPRIKKILLFDLKADPYEMNDLSTKAAYHKTVLSLFSNLMQLQKEMGDPLSLKEWYDTLNR